MMQHLSEDGVILLSGLRFEDVVKAASSQQFLIKRKLERATGICLRVGKDREN